MPYCYSTFNQKYISWSSNHLCFVNFRQGQIPTPNPPFASKMRISPKAFLRSTPTWSYSYPENALWRRADVFFPLKSRISPVSALFSNYFCVMYSFCIKKWFYPPKSMIIAQWSHIVGFTFGSFDKLMYFLEPVQSLVGIFAFKDEFFISIVNFDST